MPEVSPQPAVEVPEIQAFDAVLSDPPVKARDSDKTEFEQLKWTSVCYRGDVKHKEGDIKKGTPRIARLERPRPAQNISRRFR